MKRTFPVIAAALLVGLLAPANPAVSRAGSHRATSHRATSHRTVPSANFHISCRFVRSRADDPIVLPEQPGASHLHDFFGNRSTNAFSTVGTMRRARTTCDFAKDTAGYWFPALLDRRGRAFRPLRMSAYYWNRGTLMTAPPRNLRMIAGGDTSDQSVAGYACGEGTPTSPVPIDCGRELLKAVVVFPSCWDGVHRDSVDHRSHMAYPTGSGCPGTHPVDVPKLVLHLTFGVHNGRGFSLVSDSMGGTTDGRTLHADFWNTWHQRALDKAVRMINRGKSRDLGEISHHRHHHR